MADLASLIRQLTSGDDELAEDAAVQIGVFGAPAVRPLADLYSSDQPDIRWWAVRALAGIRDQPEVEALLRRALYDPEHSVRQCAALGFTAHPCAAIVPDLIACLSGADQLLARLAGTALIAVGAEAVPALLAVMADGPQIARLEAVKALAEIADARAIPLFFKAVQEGDSPLIEYWSDIGLNNLGIGMRFFKPG